MVPELIDTIAVDIHFAQLNPKRRLQNADDTLNICIGLVDIDFSSSGTTTCHGQEIHIPAAQISHFSVQE